MDAVEQRWARHRVVTRVARRDATAGRVGPARRQAALRANLGPSTVSIVDDMIYVLP